VELSLSEGNFDRKNEQLWKKKLYKA